MTEPAKTATDPEKHEEPNVGRSRPWRRRFVLLLVVTVGTLAALPTILSRPGMLRSALGHVQPEITRFAAWESVELSWFQPVRLTAVKLAGHAVVTSTEDSTMASSAELPPLATAESIETAEPLWKVLMSGGRGITIRIEKPVVNMVMRTDGSDLEDVIAELSGDDSSRTAEPFPLTIEVVDGTAQIRSAHSAAVTRLQSLNGRVELRDDSSLWPTIVLAATVPESPSDRLLDVTLDGWERAANERAVRAQATRSVDEDSFQRESQTELLFSMEPDTELDSAVAMTLKTERLSLRNVAPILERLVPSLMLRGTLSADARLRMNTNDVFSATVFGGSLDLQDAEIRHASMAGGDHLFLTEAHLSGDAALAGDGILCRDLRLVSDLATLQANGECLYSQLASQPAGDGDSDRRLTIRGQADLARLAAMMPATLQLHDDVRLTEATCDLTLEMSATSDARVGQDAVNLTLATSRLKGTKAGQPIEWRSPVSARLGLSFENGRPQPGSLSIRSDFGTAEIVDQQGKRRLLAQFDPRQMQTQLATLMDIPTLPFRGPVELSTDIRNSATEMEFTELRIDSPDLRIAANRIAVLYPDAESLQLDGSFSMVTRSAFISGLLMDNGGDIVDASSILDITATAVPDDTGTLIRLTVRTPDSSPAVSRQVPAGSAPRATDTAAGSTSRPGGPARGTRNPRMPTGRSQAPPLITQGLAPFRGVSLPANSTSTGAVVGNLLSNATSDVEFHLDLTCSHIDVRRARVALPEPGLDAIATGRMERSADGWAIALNGTTEYDIQRLTTLALADTNSSIQFVGRDKSPFTFRSGRFADTTSDGSPGTSSGNLNATAELRWQRARIYGLQVGPASLNAELQDSALTIAPVQVSVEGGQAMLLPRLDLDGNTLHLERGTRIDRVPLSRDLSREWLSLVMPMLGDATDVEGELSCVISQCAIPLDSPESGIVDGEVLIHHASAAAGQSLQPLVMLLDQLTRKSSGATLQDRGRLIIPEQRLRVVLQDGRIHHNGLILEMAGYQLISSGSVGLDSTVNLVLDIPTRRGAVASDARRDAIRVPVRGTASRPQPDVAAALQQLGGREIERRLDDQLNRGLKGLLDKL